MVNVLIKREKNLEPGFEKLESIFKKWTLKATLEDIITQVFDEEWDPIYF